VGGANRAVRARGGGGAGLALRGRRFARSGLTSRLARMGRLMSAFINESRASGAPDPETAR